MSDGVKLLTFIFVLLISSTSVVHAEDYSIDSDSVLVTIILKHQQDKNLTELKRIQDENKFWQTFPPAGMQIESWYVAMGLGQVITLKVAPKDLRSLNIAVETSAWGSFTTEFYPTYDFKEIAKKIKRKKSQADD